MAAINVNFPGNFAQVDTASNLRSVPSTLIPLGALYAVPELEAIFTYDPGSTAADDNSEVIRPADKSPLQAGRWLRSLYGFAFGKPGAASNTRLTLSDFKAAPTTDATSIYDASLWSWVTGDFSATTSDNLDTFVVKANSTPLSQGAWLRQSASGITMQANGSTLRRTAATVMDEFVFAAGFTGWDPTGATNSYAALMAADETARARKRQLIIQGNPNFTQPIFLDHPVNWKFDGAQLRPGFSGPTSYLRKSQVVNGPGLIFRFGAISSVLEGGGMICGDGNGGDGILILTNGVTLRDFGVQGATRDGIRIGGYDPTDPFYNTDTTLGGVNANSWNLENVAVAYCKRDGVVFDDLKPSTNIDCNTGVASRLIANNNERHGLRCGRTYLGGTFVSPLMEANGGYGIYLDNLCQGLVFIGGDVEANVAGQVFEFTPRANRIYGTSVQGVVWDNMSRVGSYTPVVIGTTTQGSATYSIQKGRYALNGARCDFWVQLAWSGHTGTGSIAVTLPNGLEAVAGTSTPADLPLSAFYNGALAMGSVRPSSNYALIFNTDGTNVAIPASGSLSITGTYEFRPGVDQL